MCVVTAAAGYTWDRAVPERLVPEWARLRERYQLGALAPRERIEEHWNEIVADWRKKHPCAPPLCLYSFLADDRTLLSDLRRVWDEKIREFRKRGKEFEEVLMTVLSILFWRVIRNAHGYQHEPLVGRHGWANRYWYDESLQGELQRAIDAVADADQTATDLYDPKRKADPIRTVPISALQPEEGSGPAFDCERDYQGRTGDAGAPTDADDQVIAQARAKLPADDAALFEDWYLTQDVDSKATIAGRHGRTVKTLNAVLLRAARLLNPDTGSTAGGGNS